MRSDAVTLEAVQKVYDAILETGGKPTSRAVRDRLGTGSMPTILAHLNTIREQKKALSEQSEENPLGNLGEILQAAAMPLISSTVNAAKRPLEEAIKALQEQLVEQASITDEALAKAEAAERKAQEETAKRLALHEDLQKVQLQAGESKALREERDRLLAELAKLRDSQGKKDSK